MTEAEMTRLLKRHKDIASHGADAHRLQLIKEERTRKQDEWVERHGLSCFKCGTKMGGWAKGGKTAWGKLWVVCQRCVRSKA